MTRLFAAILVLATAFAVSSAQDDKPPLRILGSGPSSPPFEIVQVDGKSAWRVAGRGNVRIEDLVGGVATALGIRMTYGHGTAGKTRDSVPYVSADQGVVVPNAEIVDYASDLLATAGLTIVGASTGRARVVTLTDAPSMALYVTEAELADLPASEWVVVRGIPRYASNRTLDMIASARFRTDGTSNLRGEEVGWVATGTAGEVRTIVRMIRDADQPGAGDNGKLVRAYELPANVKAPDAANMLKALFDEPGDSVQSVERGVVVQTTRNVRVNASAVPGYNRVLVRASTADHALVQAAIDAMK